MGEEDTRAASLAADKELQCGLLANAVNPAYHAELRVTAALHAPLRMHLPSTVQYKTRRAGVRHV